MKKPPKSATGSERGFGLVDFVIIFFVLSVIAFIVISNILAHNY